MRQSFTLYELFYSSPDCPWEPAAEQYLTIAAAQKALARLKRNEPSAYIVRTVRTRMRKAICSKRGKKR